MIHLYLFQPISIKHLLYIPTSTMEPEINQIEELYNRIPQQLISQFNTTLEQYSLPHSQLELSSDLDEDALNQLLKDLLQNQQLPRFEFIVEGYILRGKLKSHILRYQLTAEQTLNIQYIIAFPQLQNKIHSEEDDWISSIQIIQGPQGPSAIAASLYNGQIAIYSTKLAKIGKFKVDQDPTNSCCFVACQSENNYYCVSGGLGESLKVHLVNLTSAGLTSTHISSNKHEGSINSIAATPGIDRHIATGGSDGRLTIWNIPSDFETSGTHNSLKNKKKKIQLDFNILPQLTSDIIHNGTIQCLGWINDHEVVSSSSAHQIAVTNITRLERADTILTRDSVVVSFDTAGELILSAHEDGQIRLWDRRDPSRPANTFKSHAKWASGVRFNKKSHIFTSGSYDRTVKIWDSRCSFPLQNIQSHQEKVLTVEWSDEETIVSGGSDSALYLHNV